MGIHHTSCPLLITITLTTNLLFHTSAFTYKQYYSNSSIYVNICLGSWIIHIQMSNSDSGNVKLQRMKNRKMFLYVNFACAKHSSQPVLCDITCLFIKKYFLYQSWSWSERCASSPPWSLTLLTNTSQPPGWAAAWGCRGWSLCWPGWAGWPASPSCWPAPSYWSSSTWPGLRRQSTGKDFHWSGPSPSRWTPPSRTWRTSHIWSR